MKYRNSRMDDVRVIDSSGNVFEDLGFDAAEARVMALRAELMIRIGVRLKALGWTQVRAAKELGVTQPRVCALLKGKHKDFSLDTLVELAERVGLHVQLALAA